MSVNLLIFKSNSAIHIYQKYLFLIINLLENVMMNRIKREHINTLTREHINTLTR